MTYHSDKDGKSQTASAADAAHYPGHHQTIGHEEPGSDSPPTHEQIRARALELWNARGCPEGSPEQDWLQAEADLKREAEVHAPLKGVPKATGAVQG